MAKWSPEEDACLKACAADGLSSAQAAIAISRLGTARTESGVAGRAAKLKVSFNSAPNIGLRDFLGAGGALVRDEIGGVVGVRWSTASRSGQTFATPVCERLLTIGLLAPERGAQSVYRAAS